MGRNNIKTIVETGDQQVVSILLDLMGIGCLNDDQLEDNSSGERIKGRYQTSFWRDFIKHISQLGSEGYKFDVIQKFQGAFEKLINQIVKQLEVTPEDIFMEFNFTDSNDEQFDEYFKSRRDLGKVLKDLCNLIGIKEVCFVLI
jgi:hypothetical protein